MENKGKGFGELNKTNKKAKRKATSTAGKGFGFAPPKELANLKIIEIDDSDILPPPSFDYEQEKMRIQSIVEENGKIARVSKKTFSIYQKHLKKNLEIPLLVTGREDFPWEERYVFGHGSKEEYEELKKTNPSYSDSYELFELQARTDKSYDIHAMVRRVSDEKIFRLPLHQLKAEDDTHINTQLINDYVSWFVNWQ